MKKVVVGLKLDLIGSHPIYPVGSMTDTVFLNANNPSIELDSDDAELILNGINGHIFYRVSERNIPDLTKEQLQTLFFETIGKQPSSRLSVDELAKAIDEYNKETSLASV